jgi:hypothetical protein
VSAGRGTGPEEASTATTVPADVPARSADGARAEAPGGADRLLSLFVPLPVPFEAVAAITGVDHDACARPLRAPGGDMVGGNIGNV